MLFFGWRSWLKRLSTTFKPRKRRPRRSTYRRLQAEELEPRLAPAGTSIWTGAGPDAKWSTGANWLGGSAPTGSGSEDLVFGGNAAAGLRNTTNDLVGAAFNSISISATNYTLAGARISLGDPAALSGNSLIANAG